MFIVVIMSKLYGYKAKSGREVPNEIFRSDDTIRKYLAVSSML